MDKTAIKEQVRSLMKNMTLEEKRAQMTTINCAEIFKDGVLDREKAKELFGTEGIGAMTLPNKTAAETADMITQINDFFKETMREFIPPFFVAEALHGVMLKGSTIFPQAIAMGSTWDDELVGEVATAIAKEASSAGVTQVLCPDLDLCREPRWGRLEETFGEDPHLTSTLGTAYVNGMQGGRTVDNSHVATTLKHFAVHGAPEGGINLAPTVAGERMIQEYYLAPFRNVIKNTQPISLMPAYSEIDGVPCSASRRLLTKILRDEMGFEGYTISDFEAMGMLYFFHKTASSPAEAGKQSLHAGMDLEAPDRYTFNDEFLDMVRSGEVPMAEVDLAVERILTAKLRTNLWEKTSFDSKTAGEISDCSEHRALAFRAASESMVLLENRGVLPVADKVKSIAVIGPNADRWQFGDYTVDRESKTPFAAIKERAGESVSVTYTEGCGIYEQDESGIEAAVNAAKASELVVLCVGGSSTMNYGVGWGEDKGNPKTCGEGFDVSDLNLPGKQQQLAEAVINTGVPTVVVHIDGRPASFPWIAKNCGALIEMWYGGQEGAEALAAVLFGDVNPSGKLTVSFPESVGQLPAYYNHKPSCRGYYKKPGTLENPGRDYVFSNPAPLYSFGYGLSYTTFKYSNLTAEYDSESESVKISVCLENTGDRAGKEVVQVYFRDVAACVTRPVKELKAFKKLSLEAGEKKTVEFTVPKKELEYLDHDYNWIVEDGEFKVFVGDCETSFNI